MIPSIAMAAGLAPFLLASGADTTLAVGKGTSLSVANYAGEVYVEAWNRNAVRIQAEHASSDRVIVDPSGKVFVVKAYSRNEEDRAADLRLLVPQWMNVAVSGIHTDVIVTGTEGLVKVESVHGDVIVRGGRRRIELNTVNQDICVSDARGTVRAETVNGDAYVWRTVSDSVNISTVNGAIVYEGSLEDRGDYHFTSHNGDIAIAVPRAASAVVAVSTFAGEFESNFPVSLTESNGKRFQFCLGSCSARVDLESFQGTIRLYRAGDSRSERLTRVERIVERVLEKRQAWNEERARAIAERHQEIHRKMEKKRKVVRDEEDE